MQRTFPAPRHLSHAARVYGCWLGKSIGGTLGLPAEGKTQRLEFTFYDPVPTVAPPNDDLELQLVWLELVERSDGTLTQTDFARDWRDHIHYMWDEYGRCRWNLRRGVPVESVGTFENHFQSSMGSPIRSEIWACLFPGDLDSAAFYAAVDASLDHGTEGIAGEVFFAALESAVAGGRPLEEAVVLATGYIPAGCDTARAVALVVERSAAVTDPWETRAALLKQYDSENFTHAPLNVALTVWALLYGAGNFEASILLATNGGYDTDCTAATAGAILGLYLGKEGIPTRWSSPIGEGIFVGPGILDIQSPQTLGELTDRIVAATGKLTPGKLDADFWSCEKILPTLESIKGTVHITPLGCDEPVPWANGELPHAVKQAGGAKWKWNVSTPGTKNIVCLARAGARLFLDGELLVECPAGLPYVPATHRAPEASRVQVQVADGGHEVRLELNSREEDQEASVILCYPNLHICPWTAEELPDPARLPGPE